MELFLSDSCLLGESELLENSLFKRLDLESVTPSIFSVSKESELFSLLSFNFISLSEIYLNDIMPINVEYCIHQNMQIYMPTTTFCGLKIFNKKPRGHIAHLRNNRHNSDQISITVSNSKYLDNLVEKILHKKLKNFPTFRHIHVFFVRNQTTFIASVFVRI